MDEYAQVPRLVRDDQADAAYISLQYPCEVTRTVPVTLPEGIPSSINLDFDADGRLLGIEVIGAAGGLPQDMQNTNKHQ